MKTTHTHTSKTKIWMTVFITLALLLCASVVGNSGMVKIKYETEVPYHEYFGGTPIDLKLVPIFYDVVYSTDSLTFTERFDDEELNTWTYGETGSNTSTTSSTYAYSELEFTIHGDGTNSTTGYYNHTATSNNGLRKSSGTTIRARIDLGTGTPQAYLGVLGATESLLLGFDESGNIVYNNNGSATTIVAAASVDAEYHSFEIKADNEGSWYLKAFNATNTQVGSTVTLTPTLDYSDYDTVQLRVISTAATAETAYYDCVWGASLRNGTSQNKQDDSSVEDYASADKSDYNFNVRMDYPTSGITNDSATSHARDDWGYTYDEDSYTGTLKYNTTDFLERMASTSEKESNSLVKGQDMYAVGFDDVEEEAEADLEAQLTSYLNKDANVVDYILADLLIKIDLDVGFERNIDEFFANKAPDILAEHGAKVELSNGDVVSPNAVPAAAWSAYFSNGMWKDFTGGAKNALPSVKDIIFDAEDAAAKAFGDLSEQISAQVTAGVGVAMKSVNSMVETTNDGLLDLKSKISELDGITREAVSAPTNYMISQVEAAKGAMKDFQGSTNAVLNNVETSLTALPSRISGRVSATVSSITSSLSDNLAGLKRSVISTVSSISDELTNGFKFAEDQVFSAFSFVPDFIKDNLWTIFLGAVVIIAVVACIGAIKYKDQISEMWEDITS